MASSGSVRTAHTPATTAKAVAIEHQHQIFRRPGDETGDHRLASVLDGAAKPLQRGLQIAFGIDEEVAVDDHSVALGNAADDFDRSHHPYAQA